MRKQGSEAALASWQFNHTTGIAPSKARERIRGAKALKNLGTASQLVLPMLHHSALPS